MEFLKEKPIRQKFYNFKDGESQNIFKTLTSQTTKFTDCLKGEESFTRKVENWRKVLISFCEKSFKKTRLKKAKMKPISGALKMLFNERNNIMKKKRFENYNCPTCDS